MVMMVVIVEMIVTVVMIVRDRDLAFGITKHQRLDQPAQRIVATAAHARR